MALEEEEAKEISARRWFDEKEIRAGWIPLHLDRESSFNKRKNNLKKQGHRRSLILGRSGHDVDSTLRNRDLQGEASMNDNGGFNQVTVYQCLDGGVIDVLQSYVDEDKDESFYTLSWACNVDGTPFVVAGSINGIIRVIDASNEKIYKSFVGYGDSINEIRTQPMKPSLIVSASKMMSLFDCGMFILEYAS